MHSDDQTLLKLNLEFTINNQTWNQVQCQVYLIPWPVTLIAGGMKQLALLQSLYDWPIFKRRHLKHVRVNHLCYWRQINSRMFGTIVRGSASEINMLSGVQVCPNHDGRQVYSALEMPTNRHQSQVHLDSTWHPQCYI